jgi:SAM-dependent methyltransferase
MKTKCAQDSPYDYDFYRLDTQDVLTSPRAVVPIVCDLIQPASVLDVGCGTGAWLSVFQEHGVQRILGLDGVHINPDWLKISKSCFRAVDLSQDIELDERFDLAICLEVAEHLPPVSSEKLINLLVKAAPCVLFSAAIPLQGGINHVNEQWHEYWHAQFKKRNYLKLDMIRKQIWTDKSIDYWYRQNLYLYVRCDLVRRDQRFQQSLDSADDLLLIHRDILNAHLSLGSLLRRLPKAAQEFASRRIAAMRRKP